MTDPTLPRAPAPEPTREVRYTVVDEADEGERADVVLGRRIPALSRRQARNLARAGKLEIDGRRQPPSARVSAGQLLTLGLDVEQPSETPALTELVVLGLTDRFVYVYKPAGVHTVALTPDQPGVLATAVAQRWPECASASEDPREGGAVHRLDQPTSGVLAFARSRAAWTEARAGFGAERVAKHYLAVCDRLHPDSPWPPELPEHRPALRGWIEPCDPITEYTDHLVPWLGDVARSNFPCVRLRAAIGRDGDKRSAVRLDGRRASTVVQPLAVAGEKMLLRLSLETGRRHQARVHLAWIDLPIVGDPLYGRALDPSVDGSPGIRLHAFAIDLSPTFPDEVPVFAPPPTGFWPTGDATAW